MGTVQQIVKEMKKLGYSDKAVRNLVEIYMR